MDYPNLTIREINHRAALGSTHEQMGLYVCPVCRTVSAIDGPHIHSSGCREGIMKPVFYTNIRPAEGQSMMEIFRRAHALGYELIPFEGWTDTDLGFAGNRGLRWEEARNNKASILEIQDACAVHFPGGQDDWPLIDQVIVRD